MQRGKADVRRLDVTSDRGLSYIKWKWFSSHRVYEIGCHGGNTRCTALNRSSRVARELDSRVPREPRLRRLPATMADGTHTAAAELPADTANTSLTPDTVSSLRREVDLMRGVFSVLKEDLNMKDEQFEFLFSSIKASAAASHQNDEVGPFLSPCIPAL